MAKRQSLARNAGAVAHKGFCCPRSAFLRPASAGSRLSLRNGDARRSGSSLLEPTEREPFRNAMVNFCPAAACLGAPSGARRRAAGQKFRINALNVGPGRPSRASGASRLGRPMHLST